jgi:hypothetical protein
LPRILYIIESLGCNGAATQLGVLASGLVRDGFEVHVASLDEQKVPNVFWRRLRELDCDASQLHAMPLGRHWLVDPLTVTRLRRLVRKLRPEIVHAWSFASAIYAGAATDLRRTFGARRRAAGEAQLRPQVVLG